MKQYVKLGSLRLNHEPDPQEIGAELKRLGSFTTEALVKVASKSSSPLHKYFEWDNSRAAHAYRLHQARCLVLSVGFETDFGKTRTHESVVIDKQRQYVPIETIAQSTDLVEQVLKSAMRDLLYWRAKHERHRNFFGSVFDAIEQADETLRTRNEKADKVKVRRVKANNSTNKKVGGHSNNNRRQPAAS